MLSHMAQTKFTNPASLPIGQVRVRVSYRLRIVGFLSPLVAVLEGCEDGRRTVVRTSEVLSWKVSA